MSESTNVEIFCPECGQRSVIAEEKIPAKRLIVTCHQCQSRFPMDKTQWLNCNPVRPKAPADEDRAIPEDQDEDGWIVDHPACEGISYRLTTLGGLIRSGMIAPRTRILPPGAPKYYEAKELHKLRKFFDQKIRMNKAWRDKTLH